MLNVNASMTLQMNGVHFTRIQYATAKRNCDG